MVALVVGVRLAAEQVVQQRLGKEMMDKLQLRLLAVVVVVQEKWVELMEMAKVEMALILPLQVVL
jgi:hypothetical protein